MKAIVATAYSRRGAVRIQDFPYPDRAGEQVIVRVRYAALNPVDMKILRGQLRGAMSLHFPQVLGFDFAGEVVESPSFSPFKAGDQVFGCAPQTPGAFAEYVSVQERYLARKPENLDFNEAASLPLVMLTAWQSLVETGRLTSGQNVFIQAGGGGFGRVAIQLAHIVGAKVSTTASPRFHAMLESMGVECIVNHHMRAFEDVISEQDVAIETVDGTILKTLKVLRKGGTLVSVVGPADSAMLGAMGAPPLLAMSAGWWLSRDIKKKASRYNIVYRSLYVKGDGARLSAMVPWVESGRITPMIDSVYSLAEIDAAFKRLESGNVSGKIVIAF